MVTHSICFPDLKHCPNLEVGLFGCNILPINSRHVHIQEALETQPDFGLFDVWDSDLGLFSILWQAIFPTSRLLLTSFLPGFAGFRNSSMSIKNRVFTIKITVTLPPTQRLGTWRHAGSVPTIEKGYSRDLFQFPLNIDVLAQPCADRWMLLEGPAIRTAELCFLWEGHTSPWSSSRDLGSIQQPSLDQFSTRKPSKHKPFSQCLLPKPAGQVSRITES